MNVILFGNVIFGSSIDKNFYFEYNIHLFVLENKILKQIVYDKNVIGFPSRCILNTNVFRRVLASKNTEIQTVELISTCTGKVFRLLINF